MKIAYRTADPKTILAFGASITKEIAPVPHLLVVALDGGSRMVEYTAFTSLNANGIGLVDYVGKVPTPFKTDNSHTWNGSAPITTDYVFPTLPSPQPPGKKELTFGQFQKLCYGALGGVVTPGGSMQQQFVSGMTRYGAIVKAVENDNTNMGKASLEQYFNGKINGFSYENTIQFLGMLEGVLTPDELGAIMAAWPKS